MEYNNYYFCSGIAGVVVFWKKPNNQKSKMADKKKFNNIQRNNTTKEVEIAKSGKKKKDIGKKINVYKR